MASQRSPWDEAREASRGNTGSVPEPAAAGEAEAEAESATEPATAASRRSPAKGPQKRARVDDYLLARYQCGRMKNSLWGGPVLLLALLACDKAKSIVGSGDPAPAASSVEAPLASAAPRAIGGDDAVCSVSETKVWGKWANKRTGITPRRLGGKLALGVAFGNRPHVIVFNDQGVGSSVKPKPYAGSPLAEELKDKKSRRDLQRVTPVRIDGATTAYADYRDNHADGRRRIACELVTEKKPVLLFDGTPLLKRKQEEAEKGTPAAAPRSVAAVAKALGKGRLKLPKRAAPSGDSVPPAAADAAAPAAPPVDPPAAEKTEILREVRDCRTFVDDDESVWAVGSELHGTSQPAGTKWTLRTFVAPDAGRGYIMLDAHTLPKEPRDPKDLHTLESAVGIELGGAEHAVFGRYRGSLFGYHLDKNFRLRGGRKSYRGGYPNLPRFFAQGGDTRMLVAQKVAQDRWAMRYGALTRALPRSLEPIKVEGPDTSFAEPSLAKAGEQRWLAYHRGARRDGRLELIPVNEALVPVGKPYAATPEGEEVSESHVFALADGKLLLVFLSDQDQVPVLTSQVLSCSVRT